MGRCFYHHLAGKTAGNVKKKNWLGNQSLFCSHSWNLTTVCVAMYFKGKIKIKLMTE